MDGRSQRPGAGLATTSVSATQVSATIPASLLLPARQGQLLVFSPAPGASAIPGFPIKVPRNPAADLVLAVNSATLIPVIDGLGVFGAPSFIAFTSDPAGTPPGGVVTIPGITQPNPPLGIAATLQYVYLDASHPIGSASRTAGRTPSSPGAGRGAGPVRARS